MSADRGVVGFFALFLFVYFLESIGGFYMTSAVVAIEKQFEIPSRMSGLMVSAGDFGYIPSVVFVSYLGGKGNRARWIGSGCVLIAIANILISMSNFLFPVKSVQLNSSIVETSLMRDFSRLGDAAKLSTFLNYARNVSTDDPFQLPFGALNKTLKQFANEELSSCYRNNASNHLCKTFFQFLDHSSRPNEKEISNIRILTASPFSFCNNMLNTLRRQIEAIRCSRGTSLGPFIMIFGGLFILGIGRTMPFSLGLPLVDDNVKRQNLPILFAGMFLIRIFGPLLGFVIGAITNNHYYSLDVPPGLTPRDPMWIGCWWAGFLGIGIVMFGPSLALYLYPTCTKYKPNSSIREHNGEATNGLPDGTDQEMQPLNKGKNATANNNKRSRGLALVDRHTVKDELGRTVMPTTAKEKVMDFVSTVTTIMKCPVYVASMVGRILDVFTFKGFFVFMPKYLEVQFGLPQHKISLYLGIIGVTGYAVGVILGSSVMRKFKFQGRKAAVYVALCSLIASLLSFLNAAVKCESATSLVSANAGLLNESFTTACNARCDCDSMPLYPVCNQQGQAFFSPCHAGCPMDQSLADISTSKDFRNCKCSNSTDQVVSRDFCDQSVCETRFTWYFINLAISGIFGGMGVIPAVLISLRSVPPVDRSISLGFQGFLISLLATLPSPVFWGWIVDKSCVLWNIACGDISRGSCALYDTDKLRLTTHITYGTLRMVGLVSDLLVVYFAKGLILTDEEPTEEERVRKESHIATDIIADKNRKFTM